MTPQEIIEHCDRQIELAGDTASVGFRIPGRWGKTNARRLWKGGPVGVIVFEDGRYKIKWQQNFDDWNDLFYIHASRGEVIGNIHDSELVKQ